MTISRAVKQSVQTELFSESKDGENKVLTGLLERRELFEKMRPTLINPARWRTALHRIRGELRLIMGAVWANQFHNHDVCTAANSTMHESIIAL